MANDFTEDLTTDFQLDPAHDIRNVHGAPGWFELVTPDPDGASAYLGQVFGWEFRTIQIAGADYRVILVRGHEAGGIRQPMPGEPADPRWDTYVTVADVDELASRAAAAGAQVQVPPMPLGDAGRITAVAHPQAGRTLAFEYSRPFN
jgi:predicted enzyme related to lactoylglutathione lyase